MLWGRTLNFRMKYYIYKITNKVNKKSYVGLTSRPFYRWQEHIGGSSLHLGRDISKMGITKFTFEILDCCSSLSDARGRETHWTKVHNSLMPNGYNTQLNGVRYFASSEGLGEKINKLLKGKNRQWLSDASGLNYNLLAKKMRGGALFTKEDIELINKTLNSTLKVPRKNV